MHRCVYAHEKSKTSMRNKSEGPSRTKNTTEGELGMGSKFATEVAKRYGEGSEMLVLPWKRGVKTVLILETTAVAKYN